MNKEEQINSFFWDVKSWCEVTVTGRSSRCVSGVTFLVSSQVCQHYNKGSGPHGSCSFEQTCTKVHLCQHFVQGDCTFGLKCKRLHAIGNHGRRMLEERGLSRDVIQELPFIYRNIHHLSAAAASTGDTNTPVFMFILHRWHKHTCAQVELPQVLISSCPCVSENLPESWCKLQTDDGNNICLHFIRNSCRFHSEFTFRLIHLLVVVMWSTGLLLLQLTLNSTRWQQTDRV